MRSSQREARRAAAAAAASAAPSTASQRSSSSKDGTVDASASALAKLKLQEREAADRSAGAVHCFARCRLQTRVSRRFLSWCGLTTALLSLQRRIE